MKSDICLSYTHIFTNMYGTVWLLNIFAYIHVTCVVNLGHIPEEKIIRMAMNHQIRPAFCKALFLKGFAIGSGLPFNCWWKKCYSTWNWSFISSQGVGRSLHVLTCWHRTCLFGNANWINLPWTFMNLLLKNGPILWISHRAVGSTTLSTWPLFRGSSVGKANIKSPQSIHLYVGRWLASKVPWGFLSK